MRPSRLAPVTLAMCVLNPTGFVFIKGSGVGAAILVPVFSLIMILSYVVLWYFWRGRNWARWLVLVTSGVALLNLLGLATASAIQKVVIVIEAATGGFLLYWLNTRAVRGFFAPKAPGNAA